MCQPNDVTSCSFEAILSDPMIRLVMASDGVTDDDLLDVLHTARAAILAREVEVMPRLTLATEAGRLVLAD